MSNVNYVIFRVVDGQILGRGYASSQACVDEQDVPEGCGRLVIEEPTADLRSMYVTDGALHLRPMLLIDAQYELDFGHAAVVDLPNGTVIWMDGEPVGSTSDGLTLSGDMPGSYVLECRPPFPFLTSFIEVTVRAPVPVA